MKFFQNFILLIFLVTIVSCGSKDTIEEEIIEDIEIDNGDIDDTGTGDTDTNTPNSAYPLSDQTNTGKWILNTEVSDEFVAGVLDVNK